MEMKRKKQKSMSSYLDMGILTMDLEHFQSINLSMIFDSTFYNTFSGTRTKVYATVLVFLRTTYFILFF